LIKANNPSIDNNGKIDQKPSSSSSSSSSSKPAYDSKNFTTGVLKIDEIVYQDLPNVEVAGGKNDPFVEFTLINQLKKTDYIEEGGSTGSFPLVNISYDVTRDILDYESIKINVKDHNSYIRGDAFIGSTSFPLSFLYDHINEENLEVPLPLYDKTGKKSAGKLILKVSLIPIEELQKNTLSTEQLKTFLKTFQNGELRINTARCLDLENTKKEKFFFRLALKDEKEGWKGESNTIDTSTTGIPIFEHLNIRIPVSKSHFTDEVSNKFFVEFFHFTLAGLKETLIGNGELSLSKVLTTVDALNGKESSFLIDLATKKGTNVGKILFSFLLIDDKALAKENQPVNLPSSFKEGKLKIVKIAGNGLANVELAGKQDPFIILEIPCISWKQETKVLDDIGVDCEWRNLELLTNDLTKEQLLNENILISVYEKNTILSNSLIGNNEIPLKVLIKELKEESSYTFPIYNVKKKPNQVMGRITLFSMLFPNEKKEIPKNVPFVYLEVIRIVGENLMSKNVLTAKPRIRLLYKNASKTSTAKEEEGEFLLNYLTPERPDEKSNPTWEKLSLISPNFDSKHLTTEPLIIKLEEGGKLLASTTIENLTEAFCNFRNDTSYVKIELKEEKTGKPAGKVTIVLKVIPSTERKEVIVAVAKELNRPIEFELGEFCIKKIIIQKLKNTEWFGESDPYVVISYKEWIVQTDILTNSGKDVIYDNLSFSTEILASDFMEDMKNISNDPYCTSLELLIFDKNKLRANVLIGKVYIDLKRFVYSVNQELPISVEIPGSSSSTSNGNITIIGEMKKLDEKAMPSLPKDFQKGLIEISKISTFELKNREWEGKQDPYVIVKLGENTKIDVTPVIADGGSDVIFDGLDMRAIITKADLEKSFLTVEAWENNTSGDLLIGKGKVALRNLRRMNYEYQLPVQFRDDPSAGNSNGRGLLFIRLLDCSNIDEKTLLEKEETILKKDALPKDFKKGCFSITKIIASHLIRKGSLFDGILNGNPNPFIEFSFPAANGWKEKTVSFNEQTQLQKNEKFFGGKDCIWDLLDLSFIVDQAMIEKGEELEVIVRNSKKIGNSDMIGKGKIKIIKTANHMKEQSSSSADTSDDIKLELVIYDEKNLQERKGKIILFTKLEVLEEDDTMMDDSKIEIPKNFEYGIMKISTIECFNLKNTELMYGDKQDPYVMLTYGTSWKQQTNYLDNAGANCKWLHLPFSFDIHRESFLNSEKLEVIVKDKNTSRDAFIGKAIVSLKRSLKHLGEERPYSLTLLDEKGSKVTGKCKLYCSLHLPKPEIKLPDDLQNGNLKITRITMFGMKSTEGFLGMGGKIDPFILVKVNPSSSSQRPFPTSVKENAGGNVEWKDLDCSFDCDIEQLNVGMIQCEIKTGRTLLGNAEFPVKGFYNMEAATASSSNKKKKEDGNSGKGNSNISQTCDIITAKGEVAGQLEIEGILNTEKKYVEPKLEGLPASFKVGKILFSRLEASHLKNTEWGIGAEQDPYARLSIGNHWSETTSTLNNAGGKPIWPSLGMIADVNKSHLINDKLKLDFFDENYGRKDVPLGSGTISLRELASSFNQEKALPIQLVNEKNAIVSNAMITAKLVEGSLDDVDGDALPISAVTVDQAILEITEIAGYDLKGSSMAFLGDKEDPYVMVSLENKSLGRTLAAKNAGRTCCWKDISTIKQDVTKQILIYKRLSFVVMDESSKILGNAISKDTVLGKGELSLRKLGSIGCGKEYPVTIRLKDERGRDSGRLEIKAVLRDVPKVEEERGEEGAPVGMIGKLQIKKLSFSDISNSVKLYGKQSVFAKLSFPSAVTPWNSTLSPLKECGTSASFEKLQLELPTLSKKKYIENKLKIEFFVKGSSSSLGIAMVSLNIAILNPNKWNQLPAEIFLENQKEKSFGTCSLECRFVSDEELAGPFGDLAVNNNDNNTEEDDLLQNKLSELELSLKKQIHQELRNEKKLENLEKQNNELKAMLLKLSQQQQQQQPPPQSPPKEKRAPKPQINEKPLAMKEIQLPKNISRWRKAHAQAWLAFRMELPDYLEVFDKASMDGLLLLHYNEIKSHIEKEITDIPHRRKIAAGALELQIEYQSYLTWKDKKAKEKEEARLRQLQREEDEKRKLKELQQKKKKSKKLSLPLPPTMSKPDFIDNGMNRLKIEKALKDQQTLLKDKQRKLTEEYNRLSKTWQFEYSGKPQPLPKTAKDSSSALWKSLNDLHETKQTEVGTKNYQKTMKNTILQEITPVNKDIREIPKNCVTDEVIAILKGSMFEVSSWLLKLEEMKYLKELQSDYDLDDEEELYRGNMNTGTMDLPYDNVEEEEDDGSAGPDKESELNPSYSEIFKPNGKVEVVADEDEEDDDDEPDYQKLMASKGKSENAVKKEPELKIETNEKDMKAVEKEELNLYSPKDENELIPFPLQSSPPKPPMMESKKKKQLAASLLQSQQLQQTLFDPENPPYETNRMKLIFKALIEQANNGAKWLGENSKLTRLKLYGGIENLLRLKLSWEQFDMLWTRLDYKRSGDIDCNEFIKFFGNLNEFLTNEGMNHLSFTNSLKGDLSSPGKGTTYFNKDGKMITNPNSNEMKVLIEYLYQFCDSLRNTHFTVMEMFSSFDRNGSGEISLSEFCSLLRLVIGPAINDKNFDKKILYKTLNVLDVDGNKSISLQELLFFIYRIWKTQLNDLANEISNLTANAAENTKTSSSSLENKKKNSKRNEFIGKVMKEREDIKEAIKKNFPRQWRDKFERMGIETNTIPGPFTHLLKQLHIHAEESADPGFTSTKAYETQMQQTLDHKNDDYMNYFEPEDNENVKGGTYPPPSSFSPTRTGGTNNPNYLSSSSPSKRPGRTYLSGHNTLLRFKIRLPAGTPPTRTATHSHEAMKLSIPRVKAIGDNTDLFTAETTHKVLNDIDFLAGMRR
jgi:hypothetical protein